MTHPFVSRSLPIVFDHFVDMEFGTGEQDAGLTGEETRSAKPERKEVRCSWTACT